MSATSVLDGTRFDSRSFTHETAAKRLFARTAATPTAIPLVSAAVSSLCIAIITFVDYPWFAAAGLAADLAGLFSADLDHPARQPGQHFPPELTVAPLLPPGPEPVEVAREQRVLHWRHVYRQSSTTKESLVL